MNKLEILFINLNEPGNTMEKLSLITLLLLCLSFAEAQTAIQYKMVVAQDSSGDFTTIQDAIDATKSFPPKRITIYIKNGIYREKVRIPSWNTNLSLIGEDVDKTRIPLISMEKTATNCLLTALYLAPPILCASFL